MEVIRASDYQNLQIPRAVPRQQSKCKNIAQFWELTRPVLNRWLQDQSTNLGQELLALFPYCSILDMDTTELQQYLNSLDWKDGGRVKLYLHVDYYYQAALETWLKNFVALCKSVFSRYLNESRVAEPWKRPYIQDRINGEYEQQSKSLANQYNMRKVELNQWRDRFLELLPHALSSRLRELTSKHERKLMYTYIQELRSFIETLL